MTHEMLLVVVIAFRFLGGFYMDRTKENYNRAFCLNLYPEEDESHKKALEEIPKKFDYAYITHDKDINEEGEQKKKHTHVVIRVGSNPRWKSAVATELGIKENYIEGCNLDKMLRYLIHYDNPEKYRYDIREVRGTLVKRLKGIIEKEEKSESERASEILEFIKEQKKINIYELTEWCIENGLYDVLRRSQTLFIKILDIKKAGLE